MELKRSGFNNSAQQHLPSHGCVYIYTSWSGSCQPVMKPITALGLCTKRKWGGPRLEPSGKSGAVIQVRKHFEPKSLHVIMISWTHYVLLRNRSRLPPDWKPPVRFCCAPSVASFSGWIDGNSGCCHTYRLCSTYNFLHFILSSVNTAVALFG